MNEYKENIDDMRWSYSRVTCYDHCPYSFYVVIYWKFRKELPNKRAIKSSAL